MATYQVGALSQIIDDAPPLGTSFNQQVPVGVAQPFGPLNPMSAPVFQLPTSSGLASGRARPLAPPYGLVVPTSQAKQTHPVFPNRPPPMGGHGRVGPLA